MTDIFISYSREDRPRIEKLAAALESEGFDVWWDSRLAGGTEFSRETEAKLNEAKLVLVAWSKVSVDSHWVADEATVGRDKGNLIPIAIDDVQPKIGFRQFQTVEFHGWKGDVGSEEIIHLASVLRARLSGETPPPARPAARRPLPGGVPPYVWITAVIAAAIVAIVFIGTYGPGEDGAKPAAVVSAKSAPANEAVAPRDVRTPQAAGASASIAVLPFADLSPDGDQEYFSDGISEEILNVLTRVDGLKVASRTSSFAFKNQRTIGIPAIAEALHVGTILEGSVRKAGDAIRVTAQLIDANTDQHIWSQTYDRALTAENIFAIQDEIANAIVASLQAHVGTGAATREVSVAAGTDSVDAYDLYLRGHELFLRRGGGLKDAVLILEKAVELDPEFARAWAELGAAAAVAPSWNVLDRDYFDISARAVARAIDLDPEMALPYAVNALIDYGVMPTEFEAARENIEKALSLEPDNTIALHWRAELDGSLGYIESSVKYIDRCLEIDPDYLSCGWWKSFALLLRGETAAATAVFERYLTQGFDFFDWAYVRPLLKSGNRLGAIAIAMAHIEDPTLGAAFVAALDEPDLELRARRLEALAQRIPPDMEGYKAYISLEAAPMTPITDYALLARNGLWYVWLPDYAPFRKSENFKDLAIKTGMVEYWRKHGFPPQCRPVGADDFECD